MHKLEFRRQLLHIFYGFALLFLYHHNIIDNKILLGMIIGGIITSLMVKKEKLSLVRRLLSLFERDHHLEKFPGRGVLFFTIGSYLTLVLFERNIAYAGILILSVGDAVSNIVGRHYGKINTKLNPNKNIEGNLAGILISIPFAYYFLPNIYAVIAACSVGMFLEIPAIRIFGFEIDDNLLIPIGAAFTLTLFT
ncbi:SEC59/DGK1/VTE5 family protein [Patescibacteria group bacterium]|nr:SEC59/DGK1/VTE5 family protein [Patescibacteria group bacterium]MBU1016461.1 SEC59/DGK1/VTE5 family protein [Patescibacteria group bacterium]MBU1684959.1 SEC59/DGK1/VTE5 family protein [Patescibacteria group bacterium]MBU1939013.1 SEC59/DGK1/VTE5 family protein [Patescibacteria group bacterium]